MEVARMFGGFPHELLTIPKSEYRRLIDYYYLVKEKENEEDSDSSDMAME